MKQCFAFLLERSVKEEKWQSFEDNSCIPDQPSALILVVF